MKKRWSVFASVFVDIIIPAILLYFGQTNCIDKYFQNLYIGSSPIKWIIYKQYFSLAGTLWVILVVGYRAINIRIKLNQFSAGRKILIEYQKDIMLNALRSHFPGLPHKIEIRVFVPEKRLERLWAWIIKRESLLNTRFKIRNIRELADTGTKNDLSFQVKPKPQGLVGRCYDLKQVVYDCDLRTSDDNYNLSEYQNNKTGDLRFCMCVPIVGENNDVVAIIALDSKQECSKNTPKNTNWKDNILIPYSRTLYESLPDVFK